MIDINWEHQGITNPQLLNLDINNQVVTSSKIKSDPNITLSNDSNSNNNLNLFGGWLGQILSSGIGASSNNIALNIIKGNAIFDGLEKDVGSSVAGTVSGITGNLIGQGINKIGNNSRLSRGIGQGIATGIGTVGGTILSNLIRNGNIAGKATKLFGTAGKGLKSFSTGVESVDEAGNVTKAADAINPYALGATVLGTGLQAALGPSHEYDGRYGGITKGMDTAYDLVLSAVGFIPGYGQAIGGVMALNKGLSNVFGSTDGMTYTDAILGSAFMPAPVKWVNMWGSKKTLNFDNQSILNILSAYDFMQGGYGDLDKRFDLAREEANKRYGTFSQGARRRADRNIEFANNAWNTILDLADLNEIQNIRSQYMSSINNQRYSLMISGGYNPIYVGKQGMKILNNATNHNMGMRLLSAAALIDNKQMILSAQSGTKIIRPRVKPHGRTNLTKPSYMTEEEWDEYLENRKQFEEYKKSIGVETNNENPYTEEELKQQAEWNAHLLEVRKLQAEKQARKLKLREEATSKFNLQANLVQTAMNLQANETPFTGQEYQQAAENQRLEKVEKFHEAEKVGEAALMADLAVSAAPLLQRGFRWAFNKAGLLVKVPILTSENITENFLKFVGGSGKPVSLAIPKTLAQIEMYQMLELSGVDMSKIGIEDINKALELRLQLLFASNKRFSFLEPVTHNTELIRDIDNGLEVGYIGLRKPYLTNNKGFAEDTWILYSSNPRNKGLKIDMVENLSLTKPGFNKVYHGEQERLTNSAIQVGKQLGYEGVVSGESLLSPEKTVKMYPKYKHKKVLDLNGTYNWQNHNPGLPQQPGPVYMLEQPTYETVVKSKIFDPKIIDSKGKMKIDWRKGASMFTAWGVPVTLGGYIYANTQ